jgi:hypothetical protein
MAEWDKMGAQSLLDGPQSPRTHLTTAIPPCGERDETFLDRCAAWLWKPIPCMLIIFIYYRIVNQQVSCVLPSIHVCIVL